MKNKLVVLADERVWDRSVHDPYFQCFTGETFEVPLIF